DYYCSSSAGSNSLLF
nr:immunoglobulin light chain junction region [Macaca mulatta]MOW67300.1 immunoglobulin light chain junction region [Macaca mulatta]MOW70904.1 immunoglobulin light chain junction region [Macaca mulatta]MOW72681.1 immunoglobulin light chain junction region [Macaca mulatta]